MLAENDTAGIVSDAATENLDRYLDWLNDFKSERGRPLRVLHIGNIANNAYLNAKFLRSVGVDAYIVSHDYSHVMATPEWEEVELARGHGDDFSPVFSKQDLHNYSRPKWFIDGPLVKCERDISLLTGNLSRLHWIRSLLVSYQVSLTYKVLGERPGQAIHLFFVSPRLLIIKTWGFLRKRFGNNIILNVISRLSRPFRNYLVKNVRDEQESIQDNTLIDLFSKYYPDRPDQLTAQDITFYAGGLKHLSNIFSYFDIVQCYGVEPVYALLAGQRPYVAYEHGTLRTFTLDDSPLHRLTALAYREADHTFITNGDCLDYAQRLGIERYSPIVHPIDVEQYRTDYRAEAQKIRKCVKGDVILFCPVRHDWEVKGTDIHLRALPILKTRLSGLVKLILIEWGHELERSKKLLSDMGCQDDVVWCSSMCRATMIKHLQASDVVLDQMALPHFGATAPQAMAAGVPVISSYRTESTKWIIPEPAPILSAFSAEDVANAVLTALQPGWLEDYKLRARHWIDTYHHPSNVINDHLQVYRRLIENDR